jgi:NAD(P)-dependent dehydrogenase (short-subunit alcohol dehydrogenase family)
MAGSAGPGRALVIGNSDGIGLALTRRLLEQGWAVAGVSRRPSPLAERPGYTHVVADVAAAGYRGALASLLSSKGPFDVCVYCAGIGQLLDLADPAALDGDAEVVRVNLVGAVETAAAVLPPMLAAGRGHFVGLSSIGDGVSPQAPSYAASKAGLSSYLEALALALRPRGVRVTNLRFGFVDTKMAKSPVRPFMISAERAAGVIMSCLRRRPPRFSFPKRTALLALLLGAITRLRLWLHPGR